MLSGSAISPVEPGCRMPVSPRLVGGREAPAGAVPLPESPMKILSTLATQRHLLATMVRRDIGARFAGSSLGGLWTLIHPAIMLSLYTLVFSYIYRVPPLEGGHSFTE